MDDEFGVKRELLFENIDPHYIEAFEKINADPSHYLMVVELQEEESAPKRVVGTCHLTFLPSLVFIGTTRLQVEAVRVASSHRGKGIGEVMMKWAIDYGKEGGAKIIQLTIDKKRQKAHKFYERLGFQATHEGMKYLV